MKKWQSWLTGAALAAAMVTTGATAALADTPAEQNTVQHEPAHRHGHEHKELTPEQKDTLKQAGVDFQEMHETSRQIHDVLKDIKSQSHELKETVKDTTDTKLQEQIRSDLQSFRENMKAARELHITNRQLGDDLRQAVDAKQVAKVKEIYGKMVTNQKQELKLVKAAQATLQTEVKKIQKQVKK